MKKTFIGLIIIGFIFCFFGLPFVAAFSSEDASTANIVGLQSKVVVVDEENQNKLIVTEIIDFNVFNPSGTYELWRDMPETTQDGLTPKYTIISVKQIVNGEDVIYTPAKKLYWDDWDYDYSYNLTGEDTGYGPNHYFYSCGPYDERLRAYECLMLYPDQGTLYADTVRFEIVYEITNIVLTYQDCSDLNICFFSEDDCYKLKSFSAEILIKNEDMPKTGEYTMYSYGTNKEPFEVKESATANPGYYTFSINLDKDDLKFSNYNEFIEIELVEYGSSAKTFAKYATANDYSNEVALAEIKAEIAEYYQTPQKILTTQFIILGICLAICGSLLKLFVFSKEWIVAKFNFFKPTITATSYSEVPSNEDPVFVEYLVNCQKKHDYKPNEKVYSALLLSLVRKGYILLEKLNEDGDFTDSNTRISVIYSPSNPEEYESLTNAETIYFNLIANHIGNEPILMNTLSNKLEEDFFNTNTKMEEIEKSVIETGLDQDYFQKQNYIEPYQEIEKYEVLLTIMSIVMIIVGIIVAINAQIGICFGAFFLVAITAFACAFNLLKNKEGYILLSQKGSDEYAKWTGFKYYLEHEDIQNIIDENDLDKQEKVLVYAAAFGIYEIVLGKLEKMDETRTASYHHYHHYHSYSCFRSRGLYHSSRRFHSRGFTGARSAYHAYNSGSRGGGGGGGGY